MPSYEDYEPYEEWDELESDHYTLYKCLKCGIEKESDLFHKKRNGRPNTRQCIRCASILGKSKRQAFKDQCLAYKGGKCCTCGYDRCIEALEFHHLDSQEKDFELSSVRHTDFERVQDELDKCILVCANCHREIHAGIRVDY